MTFIMFVNNCMFLIVAAQRICLAAWIKQFNSTKYFERIRTEFLPSDSPDMIPFLFPPAPPPKLINFSQPLSLKFTNAFLLLKVNNVPLIPFQLSFWNSASMNLVQWSNHASQIHKSCFFQHNFFVKPYVPREPWRDLSNHRLYERGIYIRHC